MKDWGIYVCSFVSAGSTRITLGNLSNFNFFELVLIGFYILLMAVCGGLLGAALQELYKIDHTWIGKKKALKPYS